MNHDVDSRLIVLFDGVCNMCNSLVKFVIKRDKYGTILFASLQSESGQMMLKEHGLCGVQSDTFVFIEKGSPYLKSTAALKLFKYLKLPWPVVSLLLVVPKAQRDIVYTWIAKNRYKWFGKKEECMIPTPEMRKRFLN